MNKLIETFEEGCEGCDVSTALPDVSMLDPRHQGAVTAFYKLLIMTEAQRGCVIPNWNNNETKWQPFFDLETYGNAPAGSGFSFDDCAYGCASSSVGSRLVLFTEEEAEHFGTKHIDLYRELR